MAVRIVFDQGVVMTKLFRVWINAWKLRRLLPFYVQLAHTDTEDLVDHEPQSLPAAMAEVGRWMIDYVRGRRPVSWIARRNFLRAFRGEAEIQSDHERLFHAWLQDCWLDDQYPALQFAAPRRYLFTLTLKAQCATRETRMLNDYHSRHPSSDDPSWFDNDWVEIEPEFAQHYGTELQHPAADERGKFAEQMFWAGQYPDYAQPSHNPDLDDCVYDLDDYGLDAYESQQLAREWEPEVRDCL